jgi:hypothetical protein
LDNLVTAASLPLPLKLASLHKSLTLWGWALSFSGTVLALYALTAGKADAGVLMMTAIAGFVLTGESLQRIGFNSLGLSEEMAEQEN